ncbi:hypothetical protein [uncultured Mediterranean phage]|nr:hypothetical protein [uncultured Mediterranean phage]
MRQQLTQAEIEKLQSLCFSNPAKACAVAQLIVNTCQVVSCSTYSGLKGKSKRTINYQSDKLTGIKIDGRNFVSVNQ